MKIAVVGLRHLGTVTAACLAKVGHDVVGVDSDKTVVAGLLNGKPPVSEPGLEELVKEGLTGKHLTFTSDLEALGQAEACWVTYDTHVSDAGVSRPDEVLTAVLGFLPLINENALLLVSSQLPVGSMKHIEEAMTVNKDPVLKAHMKNSCLLACLPENLRHGDAIKRFLEPDRIVVGVRDGVTSGLVNQVFSLFAPIPRLEWMTVEGAEMTKHAINCFLATEIAFINELQRICEKLGVDCHDVERGLKTDVRIGKLAYLKPGGPYTCKTLGRDVGYLRELGGKLLVNLPLLAGVDMSNEERKNEACR